MSAETITERLPSELIMHGPYVLPDGLECDWYYASDDYSLESLQQTGLALTLQSTVSGRQVRICQDSKENIDALGAYLSEQNLNVQLGWGKNSYFAYDLSKHRQIYGYGNYTVERVTSQRPDLSEITWNYMQVSFPKTANQEKFAQALVDETNEIYVVQDRVGGFYQGSFTLKYLKNEVHLHSVAVKSLLPTASRTKNKIPIIVAKVFEVVDNDRASTLTFSAHGRVQKLYEGLGFQHSNRHGLVISPK